MSPSPRLPRPKAVTLAASRVDVEGLDEPPEIEQLSPRATAAKRASFVAGRRAARQALARRWGALPPTLRVEPDEAGRPVARVDGRPSTTWVSITHAGGWALAAASEGPIGIDLVELEPLHAAMKREAFAGGELAGFERSLLHVELEAASELAGGARSMLAACLAFGAKEAALKWLGIGMAVPLGRVRVTPQGGLERAPGEPHVWICRAQVEHPRGRAELGLWTWPLFGEQGEGTTWSVLLA